MLLHAQRPQAPPAPGLLRVRTCAAPAARWRACAAASANAGYTHATSEWEWRGHRIVYAACGTGPPCLLVHGFGASSRQFRALTPALAAAGSRVYALDLLGFGESAKPPVEYSIELWRDLCLDFIAAFCGEEPVLLGGNSIGSLVALATAAASPPGRTAGVLLLNCAGGMNNSARSDDWRAVLAAPLFAAVNALLKSSFAEAIFDRVRTRENITQLLRGVYAAGPARVDEELVSLVFDAAQDTGALEACVAIVTGPPGPRPEDCVPAVAAPLCVVWGDADKLTPHDGPVGQFFARLPSVRPRTSFHLLPSLGHCAFDESPDTVLPIVLQFAARCALLQTGV